MLVQSGILEQQKSVGIVVILVVCVLLFLIGLLRKRAMWIINIVLRTITGLLMILVCNAWMDGQHIIGKVGLNIISLLTSASLGIPGVLGLYGVRVLLNL